MEFLQYYNNSIINRCMQHYQQLLLSLGSCDLCHQQPVAIPLLCHHCVNDLPLFNYSLSGTNLLYWPAIDRLFPRRDFDQLVCVAPYVFPFNQWLPQLKFHNRFELSKLLAKLLITTNNTCQVVSQETTLLVVPSHIKKWQQRGYNQSHLIARRFAKHIGCQYLPHALYRVEQQKSQVGYSGKERRRLMAQDFMFNEEVSLPKHIVLFDDVVTTGSTVNTISQLLKQHGVQSITILAISLSLPEH
ncbi:ComF family protein [Thalassotalea hakodatensis]|uniref:ComF family protein n=1 Tax=Thalassotalea hakodatensis TaxID=3030492 RepID=UPI00257342C3|nr:ComF family protein [Thalassotalea hakodatensis]